MIKPKLENITWTYSLSQSVKQKKVYTSADLESMSASVLYSADHCDQTAANFMKVSPGVANRMFNSLPMSSFSGERLCKQFKVEFAFAQFMEKVERIQPVMGSQGVAQGKANYVKRFSNRDKLSVHAPNGNVTFAKYNERPINNFEASMIDLRPGKIVKNTGGEW